jgi:hypothetical protein
MEVIKVVDKYILKGVLQRFSDYNHHNGRIYPESIFHKQTRSYIRMIKIKNIFKK